MLLRRKMCYLSLQFNNPVWSCFVQTTYNMFDIDQYIRGTGTYYKYKPSQYNAYFTPLH